MEVEGVVFWNSAAARATQGHSIKVASQTTDLVMSPKIKETLTCAYHVTKPENLKSILGEGLKPGHELFLEGGRNDVHLSPFAPSDKRSREILGKRMRNAASWQRELVFVVVNLSKRIAREYRIVASSGVVLTGSTIPLRATRAVHVMNEKPFSVRRDQHVPESDWEFTCVCDAHRAGETKWATRAELENYTQIAARIKELRQDKYPELRLTQDVRVHRRILDTIDIDPLEGFPAEWVDTREFRRAQRSGANIIWPTSCYHFGGEFVICAPETGDAQRPIRNSLTPKAPPTPPPGAWKFESRPAAASSGGQAGATGVSPAVSVPTTKEPTEADKFERELRQLITKRSAGKRDTAFEAHVLGLQTCLKLLQGSPC